jgi:predicted nucleic acid-binding protein
MFLLDTNVLSAMMAADPAPSVAAWLSARPATSLFTTSISQAEILSGLAILPNGRRRTVLEAAAGAMFQEDFERRVLPFDEAAASHYADLFATRRRAGRPSATMDLMIAAIARAHRASLVTRNVTDFDGCGVAVVDPWRD